MKHMNEIGMIGGPLLCLQDIGSRVSKTRSCKYEDSILWNMIAGYDANAYFFFILVIPHRKDKQDNKISVVWKW